MLISKTAKLKWNSKNKKRYVDLGYKFTKMGDEFEILIEHLSKTNNNIFIKWECDYCGEPIIGTYRNYFRFLKEDGTIHCKKCATKERIENSIKTKLKNSTTFEQWCIDNNRQDLLDRWDEEKNKFKPNEISYASEKQVYLKCDKHPNTHDSEKKRIASITSHEGSANCKQCNSIMQYCIDNNRLDELDIEKNEAEGLDLWNISYCSITEVWFKCVKKDYHGSYKKKCCEFINNLNCPYCGNFKVHPLDSLGQDIINNYGEEFLWKVWNKKLNGDLDPFKISPGSNTEVWWNCLDGKHEPYLRSCNGSKLRNYRCPDCTIYTGEKEIENILIKYNIQYNMQYWFKDCKSIRCLPFDFYLPDYNILIEYDGEQHYKPVNFGGVGYSKSLDNFITTKIHDTMKNIYCQDNNIKLIRIPYYDFDNIEEILIKELNLNK